MEAVTVDFDKNQFLTDVFETLLALPGDPVRQIDHAIDDVIADHVLVLRKLAQKHREDIIGMVEERHPSGAVTLVMPSPFPTTAPADGTTGIGPAAIVSWQAVPNAAYQVNIGCYTNNVEVYSGVVCTGASQANVPNEPSFNVTVPSGATCYWGVTASGPAMSVDAFADGPLNPQNVRDWSELAMTGFNVSTPLVTFVEQ
jgi:hypothetical protein